MTGLLPDLLIISVLFLIQATFVLLVAGPLILLKPMRRTRKWYARITTLLEPADAGLPQEQVAIETFDGLRLDGWLVARPDRARGTIIYLHGVGDCKIGGVAFARFLYNKGFNVLLYDSREHGVSEGTYCTYGFYEKHDLSSAIDLLLARSDISVGKIGVYGTSMGAAIAIQGAVVDRRIAAVVAEGSFTDLKTIFVDYQKRIIKLPWHFLRNVALVQSQMLANFKARLVSPINDIGRIKVPILIVHGAEDSFIKSAYARRLYDAANEPKKLLLIENADHNDVWEIGGLVYEETVSSFFEEHLTSRPS